MFAQIEQVVYEVGDSDDDYDLIEDCLAPGAVMLPAKAVEMLMLEHGISVYDLAKCGGVVREKGDYAMSDFLKAAASYYGISAEIISKSEFFVADGQSTFVVEIPVSTEDMLGIADRMKTLQVDRSAPGDQVYAEMTHPDRDEMRAEYNGMDQATRGRFGSFAGYVAWRLTEGADVVEIESVLPEYVLIDRSEVTDLQRVMSGMDPKTGKYTVQVEDLTPQQLAAHFGVTPNADDFGGLPG